MPKEASARKTLYSVIDAVIYAVKLLVQQAGHVGADKQRDYKVKDIQQSFVYAVTGK